MKKILYIILAACVGVFGYKCSSTCQDLFRDIVEQEENRGITVATPQGAKVAIYREGKQGAPNEEICTQQRREHLVVRHDHPRMQRLFGGVLQTANGGHQPGEHEKGG